MVDEDGDAFNTSGFNLRQGGSHHHMPPDSDATWDTNDIDSASVSPATGEYENASHSLDLMDMEEVENIICTLHDARETPHESLDLMGTVEDVENIISTMNDACEKPNNYNENNFANKDSNLADDESDDHDALKSHKRLRSPKKRVVRVYCGTKPKKVNDLQMIQCALLQKDIRLHTMHLMERHDVSDPLPAPPSHEDVSHHHEQFRLHGDILNASGPTRSNFVVDLAGTKSSTWNKTAADVFANDFIECN
ncbi:hypothetical protein K439DRAFT_1613721 [Ramaria rubella]|nr:hypothetical protein K439DRAFT_1613721 [Ramaria rubella]